MPRPADVFDLVRPSTPDFRVGGWEIEFGRWQWFYVAGYRTLMARARVGDKTRVYDQAAAGVAAVPKRWKDVQPNGEWGTLAANQLARAIDGEKMRFDKAAQSILCLELAVKEAGNIIDIYDFIEIRPAMFKLGRYPDIYRHLGDKDIAALQSVSRQPNPDLFKEDMKAGKSVMFVTADSVNNHLTPLYKDLSLFLISTKSESGGTPSHHEQPMFP